MVEARYLTEFDSLQHELLNTLAAMSEQVYRANGPWTSTLLDLSSYGQDVPVQLPMDVASGPAHSIDQEPSHG